MNRLFAPQKTLLVLCPVYLSAITNVKLYKIFTAFSQVFLGFLTGRGAGTAARHHIPGPAPAKGILPASKRQTKSRRGFINYPIVLFIRTILKCVPNKKTPGFSPWSLFVFQKWGFRSPRALLYRRAFNWISFGIPLLYAACHTRGFITCREQNIPALLAPVPGAADDHDFLIFWNFIQAVG